MKKTTTFYETQIAKGLCLDTVRQQEKIAFAFENWCELQKIKPEKASYNDVLEYVNHLQSIKNMPATIRSKMNTLAHYFDYLDVKINVARLIKLKGGIRTRLYLALETEELNAIFEAQKTHGITNKRNKVVLSLIVNQGLQRDDFERIECKDIDL
jgi:site-specific recombinase XerD